MPPVATEDTRDLMTVVDDLIDRGTNKITTISDLARKLYELDPRQNVESWRKFLRRSRTKPAPERDIALIARAFGVKRSALPPARAKVTVAEVDLRLAALEAAVGLVDEESTVGNLLEELATKLGDALARIRELEARNGSDGAAARESL